MAIYNPSNDLMRLHSKYKLRSVTSQMARIAFETASKSLNDAERALVAGYLTHSSQTADKHYRMKNREHIVKGCQLLTSLVSVSRYQPRVFEERSSHAAHHAVPSIKEPTISLTRLPSVNDSKTFSKAFETLLQTHPLSLNGKRPEMKKCKAVSKEFQEKLSSQWAKKQFEMRAQHACTYFSRRKPTKEQLESWTSEQGWKNMAADCEKLLQNWAPSGSEDHIMDSKLIQTLVKSQKWRGLHIRECEGKGRGIISTRRFEAGEVLCDYHGPVVTPNRCVCHPEIQTIGRLLNHSEEKANIKPKYFSMEMDGEERDVILFLATRTLLVDEEVLFDHDFYRGALE
ncbi:N-lysine methyltransferase KMT5A-B-like [Sparus aurata]|uniref:N-lysine methyltransferase KMT5A-B-like n=1 Tax=Sparus aurata TaxID=8175 RepID=UPI0011C134A8|nr:N-lysine methyltransferase KMT5A-B-like [Sparus aurata]